MKTSRLVAVVAVLSLAVVLAPARASDELVQVASLELPTRGARCPTGRARSSCSSTTERTMPWWSERVRVTGGERARRSAFGRRYLVKLDEGLAVPDAVRRFRSFPEVEYAEPNGMVRAFQRVGHFTPNDRLFNAAVAPAAAERRAHLGHPAGRLVGGGGGARHRHRLRGLRALPQGARLRRHHVRAAASTSSTRHPRQRRQLPRHPRGLDRSPKSTNNAEGVAGLAFGCALMPVKVLDGDGLRHLLPGGGGHRLRGELQPGRPAPGEGHQPEPGRGQQQRDHDARRSNRAVRGGHHGGGGRRQRRPPARSASPPRSPT